MSEWMPIETAPKDGASVLVHPATWEGKRCSIAKWDDDRYAKNPKPYWRRDDDLGRVNISRDRPPTRWMPLPEPPK